jgi:hypothetical protein
MEIPDSPHRHRHLRESPDDSPRALPYGWPVLGPPARGFARRERRIAVALALTAFAVATGWAQPARAMIAAQPTKQQFIDQLNPLCVDRAMALSKLGPFDVPYDYARRGRKRLGVEHDFLAAADALARPPDDGQVDRARSEYVTGLRMMPRVIAAARRGQRNAWRLMYRMNAHIERAGKMIRDYGATSCHDI